MYTFLHVSQSVARYVELYFMHYITYSVVMKWFGTQTVYQMAMTQLLQPISNQRFANLLYFPHSNW